MSDETGFAYSYSDPKAMQKLVTYLLHENKKMRELLKNPCYDSIYCLHCYTPRDEFPPEDAAHASDCKWLEVMGARNEP